MRTNGFASIPLVTKNLLIINVLVFFLTKFLASKYDLESVLNMHYVQSSNFRPHQFITHMFMHASIGHLLGNMLGVWVFGSMLENVWGPKRFLIFYLVTGLGACLCDQIYLFFSNYSVLSELKNIYNTTSNTVIATEAFESMQRVKDYYVMLGASGAVYGLLMGAALLFPNTQINIYMVIPVKIKYLAVLYGISEVFLAIQANPGDSVAHLVHLGGMVFSFLMIQIWRKDRSKFF